MAQLVGLIEGLLHGELHGKDLIRRESPPLSAAWLAWIVCVEGAIYGGCMALYGWKWGAAYGAVHVLAVMIKVPTLFLLTLLVTCPSLYVFSALSGSTLRFGQTIRLLLAATALTLTVLLSLGPVTVFFTFCTKSHPFMQLLNATLFTVAGLIGMRFVWKRLDEVFRDSPDGKGTTVVWRPARRGRVLVLLGAWFVVYGVVAAQMGWLLRPFVGTPHLPQEIFRTTEGNIFQGLVDALRYLD